MNSGSGGITAAYAGKPREKYMQRLQLEFRFEQNITRTDLEVMDSYFEHRRFAR